ncbi:MAG: transpeptidase family protein [Bacteroidota bacterium]|nr:transpeptidase family protein [Bacteroidota bacterium]
MDVKKDILWRVYLCFLGIIALGALVMGRAVFIQRVQGAYWRNLSDSQHLNYIEINAERGTIYSEDSNMLSTSIPVFDVYVDFGADGLREKNGKRFYQNLDSLSDSLALLFKDGSRELYKKTLLAGYRADRRYYLLKRKISFKEYTALRQFPLVRQGRNKSGFIFEVRDNRVNPYVLLANRTVGLSRGDTSKNVGLERTFDKVLKGQSGTRLERYVAGAYIPVDGAEVEPEKGKDVITTIDTYIQDVAENALMNMVVQNHSLDGTCIVMETKTGKIKAIANLGRRPDGTYAEDYNYGIGKRTEPGSVFKLATLISLLEDKYVDTGTVINCEGGQKVFYGLRIKDSHLGTGLLTVKEAFAQSSNVAFAKMADEYYENQPQKFCDHLHKLHLDTLTGIDIVGAAPPYIKKPGSKYWSKTTIPFMAHGYEELVTPLQLLMLYNAVANGGKMMQPYLVNSINEMGVPVKTFSPHVVVNKICSEATLGKLRACLLAVVQNPHGTGHGLETSTYEFAGKTGTAVTAMDNHGYNKSDKIYQSAFIGFFPYDHPQYTIAVVIQNGKDSKLAYGASVAGPVFRDVADQIYATRIGTEPLDHLFKNEENAPVRLYGFKKELSPLMSMFHYKIEGNARAGTLLSTVVSGDKAQVESTYKNGSLKVVPDVTGLGLKDAISLLENMGLRVQAKGTGRVVYQSLAQNTDFQKGQIINLQLN